VLPALTAWEALVEHAAVQSGQRVLVHGGADGVGAFVTQLATALGAGVTSTAHTPDVEHVLALGAERVINTGRESLEAETGVFDVVIDAVGQEVPGALFAALRRGGRLITLQEPASQELADKYGVTALFFHRDRAARRPGPDSRHDRHR
jgi:NADPH:quinone reductase-like Zn-dependent oxidoreductase